MLAISSRSLIRLDKAESALKDSEALNESVRSRERFMVESSEDRTHEVMRNTGENKLMTCKYSSTFQKSSHKEHKSGYLE